MDIKKSHHERLFNIILLKQSLKSFALLSEFAKLRSLSPLCTSACIIRARPRKGQISPRLHIGATDELMLEYWPDALTS
jgi:hypothetical protein